MDCFTQVPDLIEAKDNILIYKDNFTELLPGGFLAYKTLSNGGT